MSGAHPRQGSLLQLGTTAGGGGGSHTTHPVPKDWAKFSPGPSANQKFSLVPLAPLKTQHCRGGVGSKGV